MCITVDIYLVIEWKVETDVKTIMDDPAKSWLAFSENAFAVFNPRFKK